MLRNNYLRSGSAEVTKPVVIQRTENILYSGPTAFDPIFLPIKPINIMIVSLRCTESS